MRTANFILIFRIGTDGLIIPAGRTTEPEPDIIIVSPAAAAETAAACCLWLGGGCRSESDTEPGIVTGLSLVMSTQTGRLFGRGLLHVFPLVMNWITAPKHQEEMREKKEKTREAPKNKNKTQTRTHSVSVRSTLRSSGEGVRCVVGASRLTELTDLRCVHKDVCMCRSPGCASPCLRCCHRHVAAPCLRFRSPRLRWLRWWSRRAGDWPLARGPPRAAQRAGGSSAVRSTSWSLAWLIIDR